MDNLNDIVAKNFSNWFGGSKVVDREGSPLEVYHGSRAPWLTNFDLSKEGSGIVSNGERSNAGAIWFSSSQRTASYYTDRAPKKTASCDYSISLEDNSGKYRIAICDRDGALIFITGIVDSKEEVEILLPYHVELYNQRLRQNTFITPVYLCIENPYVVDVIPRDTEFDAARATGCDGIIARNVVDGDGLSDVYVAFSPTQIKSSRDNSGGYDRDDDIRDTKWFPKRKEILKSMTGAELDSTRRAPRHR